MMMQVKTFKEVAFLKRPMWIGPEVSIFYAIYNTVLRGREMQQQ